jgi:2-succinyl-6-hydroxy-2,4-cyclohexadiene-1-carboxylate synthase
MAGLQVTTLGPAQAPLIVCLHGFLGAGSDWRPFAERLSSRYRVALVDLPGHGASISLPPAAYTWNGAITELGERMRSAHGLIGYSMGGRLALAVALTAGLESLKALVIISASPGLEESAARGQRLREDEARAGTLEQGGLPAFLKTWYDQPLFASLRKQPALRQALVDQRSGGRADELARALRGLSVGHQRPLWNELPGLQTPALFVAGEEDAVYGATARRAADLSPLGRSLMVPACGHMPHLEQPALCLDAVAEFVQQHVE